MWTSKEVRLSGNLLRGETGAGADPACDATSGCRAGTRPALATSSSLIDIPGVARRQMEQENAMMSGMPAGRHDGHARDVRPIPVLLISVLIEPVSVTAIVLVLAGRAMRSAQPVVVSP